MWYQAGVYMGEEFQGAGLNVQLGPSIDMAHDPRNGRSGETGGEDSYLIGQFGVSVIQGIQSNPVVATIKHYTAVNQQWYRNNQDVTVSEQQLMDQYGYHYKKAIQEGGALAVMSSYNRTNDRQVNEDPLLLSTILRERWGFPFLVMSDWWAIFTSAPAINAGNDVCMGNPESWSKTQYRDELPGDIANGSVLIETVDLSVKRVLKTKMLMGLMDEQWPVADPSKITNDEHIKYARKADQKAIVLLKNENDILPLSKQATVALMGPNAGAASMNIWGSSHVSPPYSVSPVDGFIDNIGAENVTYHEGCWFDGWDYSQFDRAKELAAENDVVIFFGGLNASFEGEWYGDENRASDRNTFMIPEIQRFLIEELAKVNPNLIVVLESGGVIAVSDFEDKIKGLIYAFHTTQEGGNALADVIFGDVNPAGRLPVTMPLTEELVPEWNADFTDDFHGGYRWFDETDTEYQYAFGYGLSYTTFEYSDLKITPVTPKIGDRITVSFSVTNSGSRDGEEVTQLYVSNSASPIWQPKKELKNFKRIAVSKGETKEVSLVLEMEELFYFDVAEEKYQVAPGEYTIRIGGASDSLPLVKQITVNEGEEKSDLRPVNLYTYPRYPVAGDQTQLIATVKNYGTVATSSKAVEVQWLIDGEIVARSRTVEESIPAGGMMMVSSDPDLDGSGFWIPKAGMNTVIEVFVDVNDAEDEYFETNNKGSFEMIKSGSFKLQELEYLQNIDDEISSADNMLSSLGELSSQGGSESDKSSAYELSSEGENILLVPSSMMLYSSDDNNVSDLHNIYRARNKYIELYYYTGFKFESLNVPEWATSFTLYRVTGELISKMSINNAHSVLRLKNISSGLLCIVYE